MTTSGDRVMRVLQPRPVPLDLHATFILPATAGSHHYSGSADIADGLPVTASGARDLAPADAGSGEVAAGPAAAHGSRS